LSVVDCRHTTYLGRVCMSRNFPEDIPRQLAGGLGTTSVAPPQAHAPADDPSRKTRGPCRNQGPCPFREVAAVRLRGRHYQIGCWISCPSSRRAPTRRGAVTVASSHAGGTVALTT